MPQPLPFDDLALDDLRRRRSAKWAKYGPDVLPAFVAEMDFPLAEPVTAALRAAVEHGDCGYADPSSTALAEALAAFAERRWGWAVDPDGVVPTTDVMVGVAG